MLVLTQLRPQARQKNREAKRLGHVVVGPGVESQDGLDIGVGSGKHEDPRLDPVAPHEPAHFAAVHVGQAYIKQDGVEVFALGQVQRLCASAGLDRDEVLV